MSANSAYDYLHTGDIEVERCDTQRGIISFTTKSWLTEPNLLSADGVVLEFDNSGDFILQHKDLSRNGDKEILVDLANCELGDSSYLYKLSDELRLDAFTIAPNCQISWKYVRSRLKYMRKGDVGIRFLMRHENRLYRNEEYRQDDQGLWSLKYNPNHPDVYDRSRVEDLEIDYVNRVTSVRVSDVNE
jgi:hypothetical protein